VPDCSTSTIGFLLVDCFGGTIVAADTASESATDSNVDSDVDIPAGGHV
jgi:hypothetical protein